MKKKIFAAILAIATLTITGCNDTGNAEATIFQQNVVPNVVEIGDYYGSSTDDLYYYVVDRNTGVVYLKFMGYRRAAITVMLNADGSPVTAEQLGISY